MPQMAPISWLTLFILFSLILLIFNFLNYFIYLPKTPSNLLKKNISSTPFNWKW